MRGQRPALAAELPLFYDFGTKVRIRRGSRVVVLSRDEWEALLALLLKLKDQKGVALS